jgi:hypothetical protein
VSLSKKHLHPETETERDRETERERDRETERQRGRETETERDRERQRQREVNTERERREALFLLPRDRMPPRKGGVSAEAWKGPTYKLCQKIKKSEREERREKAYSLCHRRRSEGSDSEMNRSSDSKTYSLRE